MARIVVVGAGIAGLTAALRFTEAGFDVTVLEARDRVGGRLLSVTLDNGAVAEMGGEWIRADHDGVARLARLLDVRLVPIGVDFALRDLAGAPAISREEHDRVARLVSSGIASLSAEERRSKSAEDLLDGIDDGSDALTLFRLRIEGSAAIPLSRVGVDELTGDFGVGAGTYLRVEGGNQALALSAAKRLDDVRLNTPVDVIEVRDGGVRVVHGQQSIAADGVVLAVPLPLLRSLRFDPPLDADLVEAIESIEMGTAAKLAVSMSSPPTLMARQNRDATWWCWTGNGGDGTARKTVTAFAGTQGAVSAVGNDWSQMLETAVPEFDLGDDSRFLDWGAEEWSFGCYSALGPDQERLFDAFDGRAEVVFAGEHTSGSGSIDGAILSGERAAARLAAFLSDGQPDPG
jgi:monoamine oxidase